MIRENLKTNNINSLTIEPSIESLQTEIKTTRKELTQFKAEVKELFANIQKQFLQQFNNLSQQILNANENMNNNNINSKTDDSKTEETVNLNDIDSQNSGILGKEHIIVGIAMYPVYVANASNLIGARLNSKQSKSVGSANRHACAFGEAYCKPTMKNMVVRGERHCCLQFLQKGIYNLQFRFNPAGTSQNRPLHYKQPPQMSSNSSDGKVSVSMLVNERNRIHESFASNGGQCSCFVTLQLEKNDSLQIRAMISNCTVLSASIRIEKIEMR